MHDLSTEQVPVSAYVGSSKNLKDLKDNGRLCCGSRLREGEVFAYVGLPQNLKEPQGLSLTYRTVKDLSPFRFKKNRCSAPEHFLVFGDGILSFSRATTWLLAPYSVPV
jgi:hypothetical protein